MNPAPTARPTSKPSSASGRPASPCPPPPSTITSPATFTTPSTKTASAPSSSSASTRPKSTYSPHSLPSASSNSHQTSPTPRLISPKWRLILYVPCRCHHPRQQPDSRGHRRHSATSRRTQRSSLHPVPALPLSLRSLRPARRLHRGLLLRTPADPRHDRHHAHRP